VAFTLPIVPGQTEEQKRLQAITNAALGLAKHFGYSRAWVMDGTGDTVPGAVLVDISKHEGVMTAVPIFDRSAAIN
jgi:hypothetical protein